MTVPSRHTRSGGGILLSTLIFALVIATILAGLGTLIVSFYSRVTTESKYAGAINLADAGVNYELRNLNDNVSNADLPGSATPPGTTVTFGSGSFRVYCTMTDGVTAWNKTTVPFLVISDGVIGAASRTIQVAVTNGGGGNATGVFAVTNFQMTGSATITGTVGTDGSAKLQNGNTVTGNVVFDGPEAGWSGSPQGTYGTVITNATSVAWPTSAAVALVDFPDTGATAPGGFSYLAVHNDNATASPAISGNAISLSNAATCTLVGKPGGANYYLTQLQMSGTSKLIFNNTNGPINIWCGPAGGNGNFTLNGGAAAISMASNPSNGVRIYLATTAGITMTGSSETDAGIYNVTGGTSLVSLTGTAAVTNTMVVADEIKITGSGGITATPGYFFPSGSSYKFAGTWIEQNGM